MGKYIKAGTKIALINATEQELVALLKCNIKCEFRFVASNESTFNSIASISMNDRIFDGTKNVIETSNGIMQYSEIFKWINSKISEYKLIVLFDKKTFLEKEPLILIMQNIKKSIINQCVNINYLDSVYTITNRDLPNNTSDKMYYFELNNSLLLLSKNGPKLVYGQTTSVEDIICN